jgi:hypothetical protein
MIELLIFHLHIAAALYAFTMRWQEARLRDGLLGILIFALVFVIMWSLTGQIAKLVVPAAGYAPWFTRDTASLVLVLIPDALFFRVFFLKDTTVVQPNA